jgi:hypothetical protein
MRVKLQSCACEVQFPVNRVSEIRGHGDGPALRRPSQTSQRDVPTAPGRFATSEKFWSGLDCWIDLKRSALWLLPGLALRVSAQSATGTLPPLAPPAPLLPPTFWEQHGLALLAAGFGLVAVLAALFWFVLRTRPAPLLPPEAVAREPLNRLRGRSEDGRVLSEISQILRRYLTAVLGLPHDELTTAEFSAVLAARAQLDAELAQAASAFLRECDERKFAPGDSPVPLNAAERALGIIAEMEKQQARLAVQNQAGSHV